MKTIAGILAWVWVLAQGFAIAYKHTGIINWNWFQVSLISLIPLGVLMAVAVIMIVGLAVADAALDDPLDEYREMHD